MWKDLNGEEIKPGDVVVYSTSRALRFGRVIREREDGRKLILAVKFPGLDANLGANYYNRYRPDPTRAKTKTLHMAEAGPFLIVSVFPADLVVES